MKAKSETIGYVMLFILRIIIDHNYDLPLLLNQDEDKEDWSIEELVEIYKKQETAYTTIFENGENIEHDLYGATSDGHDFEITTTHISKTPEEVDLWDIMRMREHLMSYKKYDGYYI